MEKGWNTILVRKVTQKDLDGFDTCTKSVVDKGVWMNGIYVSNRFIKKGSPKLGDMIMRNPNEKFEFLQCWLVSSEDFIQVFGDMSL